jgi:hypothetical protein
MPENEEIDLDLSALEAQLREAVGKPTTVKIDDKTVIHIDNAASWSAKAMAASASGNWNGWASEVIEDDDELDAFLSTNLKNYQMEAIFDECAKQSNQSAGKSRRSGSSSRRTPRR